MSASRYIGPAALAVLQRRLREYAETYPDSEFLDRSHEYIEAARPVTAENAAKIEDALANWERRLRGPSWDPDRCPAGSDPHIWKLATRYRDRMEERGWACPSRRLIYAEIARIVRRDNLAADYSPWRDEPDEPGWYRMLRDVVDVFTDEYTSVNALATWYAHEQLAQPGEVTGIIDWLRDQAKIRAFEDRARPVSMHAPVPERRAQVRAWIGRRKKG